MQELEGKNRELSDEIKFLEKDRLEQWERYERLLKEKQDTSSKEFKPQSTADAFSSVLGESSDLRTIRTMDDVFAIKERPMNFYRGGVHHTRLTKS